MNWLHHFQNRPPVDLTQFADEQISSAERDKIGYSLAQFQRGESSEAKGFLGKSQQFAEESNDAIFHTESQLFIKEENFHSHMMGQFMTQMNIDFAKHSWTDTAFRWLRSFGGLAWLSRVLLMAEILAQVYYPALKQSTSSQMLQTICNRIIEDEAHHITFQTERIARVLRRRNRWIRYIHSILGLILFCGSSVVVWIDHYKVFSGTLSLPQFIKACIHYYRIAMSQLGVNLKQGSKAQMGSEIYKTI